MHWRTSAGLLAAALMWESAAADRLVLADGARVDGRVDRLDADGVELNSCGSVRTYLRAAVRSIEFNAAADDCTKEPSKPVELAAGTKLSVKLSRPVDPAVDPIGQVISGSLDRAVSLGDRLLLRKSALVLVQLQPAPKPAGMRDTGGTPRPVLHVTAVRVDSGWSSLDAIADDDPVTDAAAPGHLSQFFTVRKLQAASSAGGP